MKLDFLHGLLMAIILALVAAYTFNSKPGRLRVSEIVIVDEQNRPRLVLSSSISAMEGRLRSDTLKGLLLLDGKGSDRLLFGRSPNVQSGGEVVKRVEKNGPYGFAFNDEQGNERGGFGYYSDRKLVSLGLDYPSGEGVSLFLSENGLYGQLAGMTVHDSKGNQRIYLGTDQKGQTLINLDHPTFGRLATKLDSSSASSIFHSYSDGEEQVIWQKNRKQGIIVQKR